MLKIRLIGTKNYHFRNSLEKRGIVNIEEIRRIEYNIYVRICFLEKIYNMNRNSNEKMEEFVGQTLSLKIQEKLENVFEIFMDKMNDAEKTVHEQGYFSEEVEAELAKA